MHLYTDGTWGSIPSTFDKTTTDQELYKRLDTLGFRQSQELSYRGGNAWLYTRVPQSGKQAFPLGFEFCCILSLGKFIYTVGLKSLQDVLCFYQEIDARPKETQAVTSTHLRALQQSITEGLSELAEHLEDTGTTARTLSDLKLTLDELNTTLSTASTSFKQGLKLRHTTGKTPTYSKNTVPSPMQQDATERDE